MAAIQFYHLTASPMERALPKLLEKAVAGGFRVSLLAGSPEQVDRLDQLLWTYDPGSFLAHGSSKTGDAKDQPIWITTSVESPNDAKLLCVTSGAFIDSTEPFQRILDMFDGRDDSAVEAARARWSQYKNAGHTISYLRQTDTGGWEQKAAA